MKNTLNTYGKYFLITGFTASLISCSNTKFLKEGQYLYTGADIVINSDSLSKEDKAQLEENIKQSITPKPNSSFLGLRPKLYAYNTTKEPKKDKGIRHWLKYKFGEKPVLLEDVDREFNKDIIVNYSENKGYFNARAKYDTITKNKKAKIVYTLNPGGRYTISNINFPADSSEINKEIQASKDKTLLKLGNPFDLETIKAERQRIDDGLKDRGFYYFSPDNIIVQADSTVSKNKNNVDLIVKLKDNTPNLAKQQFTIDKVVVYPNYNLRDVRKGKYSIPMNADSLQGYEYKNLYIVDPQKKFKPKVFDRALYFQKGDLYNRKDHNLSLNRLINLGVFKFVKNDFIVSDSINNKFDVYYVLTPRELQSLRLEALGRTNSANYAGSEVNLNWTQRNLFRGAEQFKASIYGAFDVQMGGPADAENIFRAGINTQLSIPRIVAPFRFNSSSAFVPRTNIKLGYEFQNRTSLYTLNTFNASFGYQWKENIRKEHELNVIDVSIINPANVTEKYTDKYHQNPYLKRVVDQQFIFGPKYSYTYTTTMLPRKNTFYYKGMLDLAGNLTGLIMGANVKEGKEKKLFGIPFSQYAKIENDVRFYHKFTEKTSFATRFIAGVAIPYGNSEHIPFSRQFFVGGSNSIRAFRARTLGPGSFDPRKKLQESGFVFDQSGDIKLELNAEYRANLFKFLNVAAFVDAGNIWLINDEFNAQGENTRPGGKFSKEFLSEVAVGAGLGLRLDFSILILRLDVAMPLRIPYYEKGERWTFDKINFGDSSWRKDNLILNIAIGYPF